MADNSAFAAMALQMITDEGAVATFIRRDLDTTYDPVTDTQTTPADPTQVVTVAVKFPVADADAYRLGSTVIDRASKMLCPATSGFRPQPGDEITFAGRAVYAVKDVRAIEPDGVPIIYDMIVEGG
jgi:hypothetical protein